MTFKKTFFYQVKEMTDNQKTLIRFSFTIPKEQYTEIGIERYSKEVIEKMALSICKAYFTPGPFKEFSYVYKKPAPLFSVKEEKNDMLIIYEVYVKMKNPSNFRGLHGIIEIEK